MCHLFQRACSSSYLYHCHSYLYPYLKRRRSVKPFLCPTLPRTLPRNSLTTDNRADTAGARGSSSLFAILFSVLNGAMDEQGIEKHIMTLSLTTAVPYPSSIFGCRC